MPTTPPTVATAASAETPAEIPTAPTPPTPTAVATETVVPVETATVSAFVRATTRTATTPTPPAAPTRPTAQTAATALANGVAARPTAPTPQTPPTVIAETVTFPDVATLTAPTPATAATLAPRTTVELVWTVTAPLPPTYPRHHVGRGRHSPVSCVDGRYSDNCRDRRRDQDVLTQMNEDRFDCDRNDRRPGLGRSRRPDRSSHSPDDSDRLPDRSAYSTDCLNRPSGDRHSIDGSPDPTDAIDRRDPTASVTGCRYRHWFLRLMSSLGSAAYGRHPGTAGASHKRPSCLSG